MKELKLNEDLIESHFKIHTETIVKRSLIIKPINEDNYTFAVVIEDLRGCIGVCQGEESLYIEKEDAVNVGLGLICFGLDIPLNNLLDSTKVELLKASISSIGNGKLKNF